MALQGTIQAAFSGAVGFDADTVITPEIAQQFADQGYDFCLRYLSLEAEQETLDLSTEEANDILMAGLALMPVQHVREPGWAPTAALGETTGANAAVNAMTVGFPAGVNVWCDLEGVAAGSSANDVIGYCNSWFATVSAAGYVPGIYVGAQSILTGPQLYDLKFEHYWKSESRVPAIPVRGYQMVQTMVPKPVNGIGIDKNVTQTDAKGGQALWLIAGA